ncbi:MAG: DNA polymerase Y family protein [Spirochaetales bacterium]|nr:DNA polymerase Y family protein [Spirochaetales bacterium]
MRRTACINIPSFALQLLSLREPLWRDYPLAVVTEEKPSGIVLEINRKAKESGVKTGMRFSAALALAADLHAGTVSTGEINDGVQKTLGILLGYSPEIEPFELCPGVFWVNASGFERLHSGLSSWAEELLNGLKSSGFMARISVGFSRFGSFVAAKRARCPLIFKDPEEEIRFSRYTPLTLLPMPPKASNQLQDLGIKTIGAFLDLPAVGVRKRFREDVCRWYEFASEKVDYPIQPRIPREDFVLTRKFQPEIVSIKPVLLHFRRLLDHLLTDVMKHNELVHTLSFALFLEDGGEVREQVSPSRPTVRPDTLFRLMELRLQAVKIGSNIAKIEISAGRVTVKGSQELLFNDRRARDLAAGAEAFALIRAEFGNDAVQHAEMREEHLPEKRVEWVNSIGPSVARVASAVGGATGQTDGAHANAAGRRAIGRQGTPRRADSQADATATRQLVRRMYLSCTEIEMSADIKRHRLQNIAGPVRYESGWWDGEASRDYYYLKDGTGSVHWAYKNLKNGAWSFQGFVS